MISFITCSVNEAYLENLKRNLSDTVGAEYELLAVDNRQRKSGLCMVYNEAAAMAKYPYLCFVHEDVEFQTKDWGKYLLETLAIETTGILGICGGKFYPRVPGAWLDIPTELRRMNMLLEIKGEKKIRCMQDTPENHLSYTVILDGLMLAMRKRTWEEFQFNELITGFEFYDIDICLRVGRKYKLVIDHRILVEHFGKGRYVSKQWIMDALNFYDHKNVQGAVSMVNSPPVSYLEDFAFKRFVERVAATGDDYWKIKILTLLFLRFPWLTMRNVPFYLRVGKRMRNTGV